MFIHQAGEWETPPAFLEWGAVSLLAACAAERCYSYFLSRRDKLFPNLYTFLLADSGTGKGVTCNMVNSFLKPHRLRALTGLEESRTTAQGVMDRLSGRFSKPGSLLEFLHKDEPNGNGGNGGSVSNGSNGSGHARRGLGQLALIETEDDQVEREAAQHRIFLVFEELALSIGSGQRADDFIKFLTKVYGGQGFVDRTRTWGEIDLGEEVCLNVLAGSTHRWLKDCVTLDSVLGGFFARVIVVDGDADSTGKRVWRPKFPQDADRVRQFLERRVAELTQMSGEFRLTDEADAVGEKWYMDRPEPEEKALGPIFRRERATVLKLAHIFAMSEGVDDFKIHSRHMARAQAAIRKLGPAVMRVVAHTSITKDTRGFIELREFIRLNKPSHNSCAKYMGSIGCGSDQFRKLLAMIRDMGELKTIREAKDGSAYYAIYDKVWSLHEVEEPQDGDENQIDERDERDEREPEISEDESEG